MANIPGTNVASTIAPFTTDDQFPTHDAIYGKGGQREVATIAERDAIPLARLTEGCTCYVAATEKTYRWKSNAWVDDTPAIATDASDIDYTPSGSSTPTNVAAALDSLNESVNNLDIPSDASDIDYTPSGSSTQTTVASALDSINESVSGLEDSVQGNADDIANLQEGAVAVDVNTTTKVFAIKNAKGQNVGTITVSETTGLPATLTLAKAGTNGQNISVSLPTLAYNSQTQILEYVDATGNHVPTIKLSNLQIKTVFDYNTYEGDAPTSVATNTYAIGDLALVEKQDTSTTPATVSYELAVVQSVTAGSPNDTIQWQSLGSINNVSLVADQVPFDNSENGFNATNVQDAIEEVNEKFNLYEELNLSTNVYDYRLTSDKRWDEHNTGEHYYIPCVPGTVFRLKRSSTRENNCNYAFLTSHNFTNSDAAVSSIYTEETLPYLAPHSEVVITAPEDAVGLAINKVVASGDVSPNKVEKKSNDFNSIINELVTMPEGEIQEVIVFDDLSKFVDPTVVNQGDSVIPLAASYENDKLTLSFTGGDSQALYIDLDDIVEFNTPYTITVTLRRIANGSTTSQSRQLCIGFSVAFNKTDEFIAVDPSNETTISATIIPMRYKRLYIGIVEARNGGPTYEISKLEIKGSVSTVKHLTKAAQMIYELKEAVEHGGDSGSSEGESIIKGLLPHGTTLFTSDNFKTGDAVHISLSRNPETTYAFIEFYDVNNTRLAICGLLSNNLQNDFEGDFLIPSGFKYASLYAKERSGNTQVNSSCTINAIYRVSSEWGVYKFGNPMFETIASYNAGSQNQISTENIFEYSSSPKKVRMGSMIITNAGTILATCFRTPNAKDSDPGDIILARKASGDSEWSYQTVIPFDSTNNRKVMNVAFIVDRAGVHGYVGRIYLFGLALDINNSTNKGMAKDALTSEIAEVFVYSDDDGVTWSAMQFLDKSLWDINTYKWMGNGPCNGIITQDGTMVIGCMGIDNDGNWRSCVMYKKVGQNWHFSSLTSALGDNEDVVFEGIKTNEIYLNCRNEQNSMFRNLYKLDTTTDELIPIYNGFYNENQVHLALQCCITKCTINGDTCYLMTYADPTGEFTENNVTKGRRNRITVWASADGIKWTRVIRLTGTIETAGYSMISCYNGKCVVVYENDDRDTNNKYKCERIGFADLTPALELLHQSALMCGDTPEGRIHRVREYQISNN